MLDDTDKKIIKELKQDGRITMKELGERVHLTGQATANRVLKLEEEGIIEGYTIRMNRQKAGDTVQAFIHIFTKTKDHDPLMQFMDGHRNVILNSYRISGEGCYLIEVAFPSNTELDQFLQELIRHANYRVSIVISKQI
ncbi:Lrp/AsnC family transcriptional regulator [Paenibacillus sp. GCM10012307]|uniref:Lrp/AsnC family transcriptional regulator n=1 Tax=Paenibacillus roseus TaxID=2798579 RepID=A0A934MRJ6_9BACL|nr:Lrp/AsnC family transcriptional regulator [Paenibacillus roseus]MBJ6362409.1 Lrp/AsnC family transcriptional regulator [Paenibacillus roseus]